LPGWVSFDNFVIERNITFVFMIYSKTIKTALASFGMSGQIFHGPLLKVHPGFEVVKILERTRNLSKSLFPDAKVVRSYKELLQDPSIRLVIVNTPDHLHYEMTHLALEAGKDVVVEKPFTLTAVEGKKLIDLAHKKNKLLTVFQNRRLDNDFLTVKQVLKENRLGRVVEYEAHFDRYKDTIAENSWKETPTAKTDVLYNLGSHLIDQALVLFGLPLSLFADLNIFRPGSKVVDYFHIHLYYPGFKAILKTSYQVREPGPKFMVHGTLGSFIKYGMDPQEDALKAGLLPGGPDWGKEEESFFGVLNSGEAGHEYRGTIAGPPGDYPAFYRNLYEVLTHKADLMVNADEALQVIHVIELARMSAKQGKIIQWQNGLGT